MDAKRPRDADRYIDRVGDRETRRASTGFIPTANSLDGRISGSYCDEASVQMTRYSELLLEVNLRSLFYFWDEQVTGA
jgi:hypothetical protein